MIVLRAVRVEYTGAETELGEVRLAEVGAGVFAHSATPEGHAVIADLRERLSRPVFRSLVKARMKPSVMPGTYGQYDVRGMSLLPDDSEP